MDIIKIIGLGILGTFSALLVKEVKPWAAVAVSIATAVTVLFSQMTNFSYCISVINEVSGRLNIKNEHIGTIIKMIGVAYLSEFGAEVCRDAGEAAVASKIELAGKVIIVTFSFPVLIALLNLLISIMP